MGYLIQPGSTPDDIRRQRLIAEALMARGSEQQKIINPWQGVAQLGNALVGALMNRSASSREDAAKKSASDFNSPVLAEALRAYTGGGGAAPAGDNAATTAAAPPAGTTPKFVSEMLRNDYKGPAYYPPAADREAFIREEAGNRGMEPGKVDAVVRGLKNEGLQDGVYQSNASKNGVREPSYGDGQLMVGGPGTGYKPGIGNEAMDQGIDVTQPANWHDADRFMLDKVNERGSAPWYGFKKAGVSIPPSGVAPQPTQASNVEPEPQAPLPPTEEAPAPAPTKVAQSADIPHLLQIISNSWSSDGDKAMAKSILEQTMKDAHSPADWGVIGEAEDQYGKTTKQYGWIDKVNRKIARGDGSMPGPSGVQTASDTVNPSLTGEDYLKTLPEGRAARVKRITSGLEPYPSSTRGSNQMILEDIARYKPGYNAQTYKIQSDLRTEYSKGQTSKNIKSINTAMYHLNGLKDAIKRLNNTRNETYNTITGGAMKQYDQGYQSALADYATHARGVASELATTFRGGDSARGDVEDWAKSLDPYAPFASQQGTVTAALHMIHDRLSSQSDTWNKVFIDTPDEQKTEESFLTPDNATIYQKLFLDEEKARRGME